MQKGYVFFSCLLRLFPKDVIPVLNLEYVLQLKFQKLQDTLCGRKMNCGVVLIMRQQRTVYVQTTEADKVVLHILHNRFKSDGKLGKIAPSFDL